MSDLVTQVLDNAVNNSNRNYDLIQFNVNSLTGKLELFKSKMKKRQVSMVYRGKKLILGSAPSYAGMNQK